MSYDWRRKGRKKIFLPVDPAGMDCAANCDGFKRGLCANTDTGSVGAATNSGGHESRHHLCKHLPEP